jgi:glycosyltransferase involved in cell wall biosynthesis
MNILHLLSEWKWTGPADPVMNLCQQLERRGHRITFAYRRPPREQARCIEAFVRARKVTATDEFHLNRYFSLTNNPADILALRRFIRRNEIQIVNTHLDHDHLLGGLAARLAGNRARVIRADHKRDSFSPNFGNKILLSRLTDGVITFSEKAHRNLVENLSVPEDKIVRVNPAVDISEYNPSCGDRSWRRQWNLSDDDVVVGVVARFQRYRRMDIFLEALRRAVKVAPKLKALLVGRGGRAMQETVVKPIEEMKLQDHAIVPGYQAEHYRDALASMDVFAFLIAGSDGTGRALREAMAMGKPAIVNNLGMLPEMVDEGRSGIVFNDNPDELADAMIKLATNRGLRENMAREALKKAQTEFSLERQAGEVEAFYNRILGGSSESEVRK